MTHRDDSAPTSPVPFTPADRELGVVVGFDGSEQSVLALSYAARAAQHAVCPLTVVTAFTVPAMRFGAEDAFSPARAESAREAAGQAVLGTARELLHDYPGDVSFRTEQGDAAGVMVRLSGQAQLAVVGARGRGGFVGRLLGSVSSALPAHAHCPTVVVPRGYDPGEGAARFTTIRSDAPVVLGVPGPVTLDATMLIAIRVARGRDAPLHLVHAVQPIDSLSWAFPYAVTVIDQDTVDAEMVTARAAFSTEVDQLRRRFPDVHLTTLIEESDPVAMLARLSGHAQLTIVGTRGHGRWAGALLGSVSRGLLEQARGPVMVVPDLDPARIRTVPRRPR